MDWIQIGAITGPIIEPPELPAQRTVLIP